jgi:hypothetical protein
VWAIKEPTFKWPKGGVSKAIQLLVKGAVKQEAAKEALPDHIVDWVWLERSQLTKDETVELDTDWIQENLVPTIKFYHRVLTFWDSVKTEHSNQIRQKPFTLAPTHQTRRLFVNLDNTAFYLLLKALNKVPERPPMVNGLKELQDKLRKEKLEAQAKEKKEWEEAFKKDNGRDPEEKDYPRDLLVKKRVKLKKEDIEKIGEDALDDEMYFKIVKSKMAWRAHFHLEEPSTDKAKTKWEFANHIATDGVSLCLLFTKRVPKKSESPPEVYQCDLLETLRGKRTWYVDPGRTHIVTAVRFAEDEEAPKVLEEKRYSRREYYNDAGIFDANETRRTWNASWMEDEEVKKFHKECTFRTASYESFVEALKGYAKVHKKNWSETRQARHSRLSMQTYQGKQSALMRFWNGLSSTPTERSNTVVVYGVCYRSMACGGKGEISVPVKVAHKTCKLCYTVYDLDEFRTSKLCALCGGDLELLYCRRNDRSAVKMKKEKACKEVRGLRCCQNALCARTRGTIYVDRDLNACWNFWTLCRKEQRPTHLSRAKDN